MNLILLISLSIFVGPKPDDPAPIGLISMVKGPVQIQHAGKAAVPAKMADLIGPGDRLITGPNAEALFLFCPGSRAAKLSSGGDVTFTNTSIEMKRGELADDHKIAGCRLPSTLALSSSSQQQVGLMKTRGVELSLRSPSQGTVIVDPFPKLRWTPVKDAVKYEVSVRDREEKTLYKTTVTGTEVTYPSSAPSLQAGQKYWWRVTAVGADDKLGDAGDYFRVMPAGQIAEFKSAEADLKKQIAAAPGDSGPRILLAFLYEENSMYDSAARTYDALAKQVGDSEWIRSRLNTLLNKLGWPDVN